MEKKIIDCYKTLLSIQNALFVWLDQANDDDDDRQYFRGQYVSVSRTIHTFESYFPELVVEAWEDLKSPDQSPE